MLKMDSTVVWLCNTLKRQFFENMFSFVVDVCKA